MYKCTEQHKKNISLGKKGKSVGKGRRLSEQHKKNIGAANAIALKGKKFSEERRKKLIGLQKGEKHPRWIKDRSLLVKPRNRWCGDYIQWRTSVFKRDKWRCRIGGVECENFVVAHHILPWRDYPELRYEVNNGITLCKKHHPRKRKDEMVMSPYFQRLLTNE